MGGTAMAGRGGEAGGGGRVPKKIIPNIQFK